MITGNSLVKKSPKSIENDLRKEFILASEDSNAFLSLILLKSSLTISSLTLLENDIKSLLLVF